ncbi:Nuclear import receptor [Coelomomyces lativittatus]|nr:Nuclear import receptor [Coelomomyces lativittatus]KAJ1513521.1 Nuclear import receptor [Coelomomyces lativittatus]
MELEFCKAVETLHSATENSVRNEASEWLECFEKSDDAWSVATSVLSSSNPSYSYEARVFASQVLRHKVIKDLFKCDTEMIFRIRDALLNLLSSPIPSPVAIQLCCALAELAIHFSKWKTPVETMHRLLANDPRTFHFFLEFMKVLPEELSRNERVFTREEYADRFSTLLEINASSFFQSLVQAFSSDVDFQTKKKLFDCLESWMSIRAFPFSLLLNSPILQLAFDVIKIPDLFDTCVCILSDIFELANHAIANQTSEGMKLVQFTVPMLLQTANHFLPLVEEDEDMAKSLMKLFSSACTTFLPLILIQPAEFSDLLYVMLRVTRLSFLDSIPICLNFWFSFTEALLEPEDTQLEGCIAIVVSLVDTLLLHLRYPEEWNEWNAKEKDDFREFRHHVGDLLKNCVYTIGQTSILEKMLTYLRQASTNWRDLEKLLFGLRTMAAVMDPTESNVFPHIMDLVCAFPYPDEVHDELDVVKPSENALAYPILLFFGSYSRWTSFHAAYLPIQMQWIGRYIKTCPTAASKTFRHIAEDCASHLLGYFNALEPIYQASFSLPKNEALKITEAMARVLNEVHNNEVSLHLARLTEPLIQQLLHASTDIQVLNPCLYKLALFIEFLHKNHPFSVIQLLEACWKPMAHVLERFPTEDLITEGVCKVIRASLHKETVTYFTDGFVDLVIQLLVGYYQSTLFSCWLWIGSHVIDKLCMKYPVQLERMMQQFMDITLCIPFDQYLAQFEVLNEFFGVLLTFVHMYPDASTSTRALPESILMVAAHGLKVSTHPNTLDSILMFCNEYVQLGGQHHLDLLFSISLQKLILGVSQDEIMYQYIHLIKKIGSNVNQDQWRPHVRTAISQLPSFLSPEESTKAIEDLVVSIQGHGHQRLVEILEKLNLVYERRIQRK